MTSVLCFVPAPSVLLEALKINMCQDVNKPKHYTTDYYMQNLVVRRGQEFVMQVTFNRPLAPEDDFHIEFTIGEFEFWASILFMCRRAFKASNFVCPVLSDVFKDTLHTTLRYAMFSLEVTSLVQKYYLTSNSVIVGIFHRVK